MEDFWSTFCGASNSSDSYVNTFRAGLITFMHPSSCINHLLITCFDILLFVMLLFVIFLYSSAKSYGKGALFSNISTLQVVSSIYNSLLAVVYLSLGVWILEDQLRNNRVLVPLHRWLFFIVHGLIWLLLGLIVSLRGQRLSRTPLRLVSTTAFLFAGITCVLSVLSAVYGIGVSPKIVLDAASFLGSVLLLLCTYRCYDGCENEEFGLYDPLFLDDNGDQRTFTVGFVSPFAKANLFSRYTFSWLNPLMKRGREKTLGDEDIPKLGEGDRAKSCYSMYMETLKRTKESDPSNQPSILRIILKCHGKEILVSGLFAVLKVVTISTGPLLLKGFIKVAEGKESFKHGKYILVLILFCMKILESVSERQWFFRARLVGLKVTSLLTAVIYEKQLRLSNAAKLVHSSGEIMNYATVDAYRVGEFPYWFHRIWTTSLQLCLAIIILFQSVGLATIASIAVIVLTVGCNAPIAKLQHKYQTKLMLAQDGRLKAITEALVNMKVLKLYAWETHFRRVIENLRTVEDKWLSSVQQRKAYDIVLFWASPLLVSVATFGACQIFGVALTSSNVFTFIATLSLVQDPIRAIPGVIAVFIQAKVAFSRIIEFLESPELKPDHMDESPIDDADIAVYFKLADLSWNENVSKPTLESISLVVKSGSKIAICGEVGSGKSTLLAAILGEVPVTHGTVQVHGSIAYVPQSAWIQSGSIQENILFGSTMDNERYQDTLNRCSLLKDLELLPYGDLTEIGERGINLSGGQKQRIQLARALYKDADVYLLDDPFSAVDAHTATSLFNEYVVEALSGKTVILITHQVEFLPTLDSVLMLSDRKILHAAPYNKMLVLSQEFHELVNTHKETTGTGMVLEITAPEKQEASYREICTTYAEDKVVTSEVDQLIKKEEREVGDTGLKAYILYLKQKNGFLILSLAALANLVFMLGTIMQNSWMARNVDDPHVSRLDLIVVYLIIGVASSVFLGIRAIFVVVLGMQASRALFSELLISLFRAPMSFYDSTPVGRILSRVCSDLSIVDIDLPLNLIFGVAGIMMVCCNLVVLAAVTWQVLFVAIPMVLLAICLQRYYFSSAKELMRINGTTKSFVANHLSESLAGGITIRAFKQEARFFAKNLELIDTNGSPFFHYFSANEWLIQRLEVLSAVILSFAGLCMVSLPHGTLTPGFAGMAFLYGLSLNVALTWSINYQCTLANCITSVERLDQYMHIPSEAPEVIEDNHTPVDWPAQGKVDIQDLKIRYRPGAPLVLRGISCTFEGGHKIGIVGRTGSGKTTLIGALFRLVEPAGGKIVVDGIDISTIGLHDLRSHFGIIPQEPTLFAGTVRYNLDPLGQHTDQEIWEVLAKCQLRDTVQEKEDGLDSAVVHDGSNWSMGERQLFCLGRALLRRSKILVLDEATASIDNATDMILQKTIRTEFADCTVITVAHRIPTVMDCTMVLGISDGKLVEYDEPTKLMRREDSLFGQLVKEYWSHHQRA